jgi:hypothetical protein
MQIPMFKIPIRKSVSAFGGREKEARGRKANVAKFSISSQEGFPCTGGLGLFSISLNALHGVASYYVIPKRGRIYDVTP